MKSKTIVLTGATRGLGRALLDGFSGFGHTVLACGRSASAVKELQKAYPGGDISVVDVSSDAEVSRWSKRLIREFGAPDLLINNAALITEPAPLWEQSAKEFDALIDVNIKGVANTIRAFTPAMIENGRGVIVNLSSEWGRSVSSEVAPYCASKWAIEGLTKALAEELPRGLSAVPLNPGIINTEMLETCFGDAASSYPGPEEWAEDAVPFILKLGPRDNGVSLSVG